MANEQRAQIVNPQAQVQIQPGFAQAIACQPGQDFEVLLTVLPNGSDGGNVRFSVLVSPRLKPACDVTLANFPMFLDWPSTVRGLAFQLLVDGLAGPIPAQPLYNPAALDSNLWKAIFLPATFVRQYRFDQGDHTNPNKYYILPLRERNFHRFQLKQDLYQSLAVDRATKLPDKNLILDRLSNAGIVQKVPSKLRQGQMDYRMMGTQFQNPAIGLLNMRDQMIQQELKQFQGLPGGQLPGGQVPGGGRITPGGPILQQGPGGAMIQPGQFGGARVFQRGAGGKVSARKVPSMKDQSSIQAATGLTPKQYEFAEYRAFSYKADRVAAKSRLPAANEWKNIIDFHQIVAALGSYPEVMRRVGLVLDFVVPDKGLAPTGAVSVVSPGLPPEKVVAPKTQYDKTKGFRTAAAGNPEIQDGLVKFGLIDPVLKVPLYDVVPGDVEGAMAKVSNFTQQLLDPTGSAGDDSEQALPALRSGGLGVAHAERDLWLDRLMDASQDMNKRLQIPPPAGQRRGSNIYLSAENVIRGFRIDVRSRRAPNEPWGPWRSLCDRQGLYYLGAGVPPVLQARDEGWVSLGITSGEPTPVVIRRGIEEGAEQGMMAPVMPMSEAEEGAEPVTGEVGERGVGQLAPSAAVMQAGVAFQQAVMPVIKPLLIYESLFRWVGWGLNVQRPYRSMPDAELGPACGLTPDPDKNNVVACPPIPGLNLMAAFVPVPGTLPRLRFGRQYQFRARIVDLAGNSRLLTDPVDPSLEPQIATSDRDGFYDRFEPVPSPVLVLTRPFIGSPVAAPQRQVVPPGGTPFPGFPDGEPLSPGESVPYLIIRTANVDPRTEPSLQPLVDPIAGPKAGPENPITERHVVPPQISEDLAEKHGMFDNGQTHMVGGLVAGKDAYDQIVTHDATLSEQNPTPPGVGDFFVDPAVKPFITVPYLPDPMAVGVTAVLYAPGQDPDTGLVVQQPYGGNWPDMVSFRLLLKAGVGNPQFNNGVMEVPVPIGEERRIRLSSFFKPGDERLFGIWRWITERATPQQLNDLLPKVVQGRHWMLTPYHELRLFHAVQQPVLTPQWVCVQVLPQAGLGQAGAPPCTDLSPAANAARHRRLGETIGTIDGTMLIHRPSTQSLDLNALWREPVDQGLMRTDQEDPERRWLYVEGKASPFAITMSYVPEVFLAGTVPAVVARGVPGEAQAEGGAAAATEPEFRILQDAQEMPVDSEVQTRGLPEGSSQAPAPAEGSATGGVQERGTAPLLQFQQTAPLAQLKQKPPIAAQQLQKAPPVVAAPKPQGPPAFDETPYRCAPPMPPPPPMPRDPAVAQFRFQGLHRFGDTKYRCVSYKAVATSRYRHMFRPLPIEQPAIPPDQMPRFTKESPWIKADVLNTAPPDAPKVLYIIPTFKWETTQQGVRRRVGGGLRVYLDRPWYSSGDGERLAVVLTPDPRGVIEDYAKPYVSQWGLDPIWQQGPMAVLPAGKVPLQQIPGLKQQIDPAPKATPHLQPKSQPKLQQFQQRGIESAQVHPGVAAEKLQQGVLSAFAIPPVGGGHPAPQHFRNEDHVRYDLGISEVQLPLTTVGTREVSPQMLAKQSAITAMLVYTRPMPVTICAFNVQPDPSRQLWYCDIEMDPGAEYYPFVRLALARYQVNSVRGAHLSKVVMADFIQLVPERALSATPDPKNPGALLLSVTGAVGAVQGHRRNVLEAIVEENNPNVPGELGWSPVPGAGANESKWQQPGPQQRVASVPLPPAGSGKVYRIVVKEYEEFLDSEVDEAGNPMPRNERRLVYVDVLPVQG